MSREILLSFKRIPEVVKNSCEGCYFNNSLTCDGYFYCEARNSKHLNCKYYGKHFIWKCSEKRSND